MLIIYFVFNLFYQDINLLNVHVLCHWLLYFIQNISSCPRSWCFVFLMAINYFSLRSERVMFFLTLENYEDPFRSVGLFSTTGKRGLVLIYLHLIFTFCEHLNCFHMNHWFPFHTIYFCYQSWFLTNYIIHTRIATVDVRLLEN